MRISDWSSDVCSSDLRTLGQILRHRPDGGMDERSAIEHGLNRDVGRQRGVDFLQSLGNGRCDGAAVLADPHDRGTDHDLRSEEHTSELQSLMRISYAVFCLIKKKHPQRCKYPHKDTKKTTQ